MRMTENTIYWQIAFADENNRPIECYFSEEKKRQQQNNVNKNK